MWNKRHERNSLPTKIVFLCRSCVISYSYAHLILFGNVKFSDFLQNPGHYKIIRNIFLIKKTMLTIKCLLLVSPKIVPAAFSEILDCQQCLGLFFVDTFSKYIINFMFKMSFIESIIYLAF